MENSSRKNYKIATALSYKQGDNAPIVVAKGKGFIAEKIIKTAQENNVPIHTDANCARLLNFVEVDQEIPAELYEVVAKILIFIDSIDKEYKKTI